MKKIVIIGGTGMIGRALALELVKHFTVVIVSRDKTQAASKMGREFDYVELRDTNKLSLALESSHAVINLAGKNISTGPWNKKNKQAIINSRVETGHYLTRLIMKLDKKPDIFVQVSGISYYSNDYKKIYNEEDKCFANSFLHGVVKKWEASTLALEETEVRRIVIRLGIVFDKKEGAFPKLLLPFKYFVGGKIGNGKQWVSWVHVLDVVMAIKFLIQNLNSRGVYNLTSPEPVTNEQLCMSIKNNGLFPAYLTVPAFIIQLFLGQKGEETILASQCVKPEKLIKEGFQFKYDNIDKAVINLIN